jgi:uncharacterized protein YndB with AHSA1/START domain
MAAAAPAESPADREIVVTRTFDAPRALVWAAWTDPKQIPLWWGPRGFTSTILEMDLRVGGVWRSVLHGPDGTDYPNRSVFEEVVTHERLVYRHGWDREGAGEMFRATVTFEDAGGKTRVTLRSVFPTKAERVLAAKFGAVEGAHQTLARFGEHLSWSGRVPAPAEPQVAITREFDAPRDLVFRAWTDPESLARWFAPNGCAVRFAKLDVRPGGRFHSCITTPDGTRCWCLGVYREVAPPSRLSFTMGVANANGEPVDAAAAGMDPAWPAETLVTITFEDVKGRTRLTLTQTVSEALAKKTGAHPSWLQMFDRLAADPALAEAARR